MEVVRRLRLTAMLPRLRATTRSRSSSPTRARGRGGDGPPAVDEGCRRRATSRAGTPAEQVRDPRGPAREIGVRASRRAVHSRCAGDDRLRPRHGRLGGSADATLGRVVRVDRGLASVLTEAGPHARQRRRRAARPDGRRTPTEGPCAGDWCVLREWPDHRVTIERVLPRRTAVVRATAGEQSHGQVLCANVDLAASSSRCTRCRCWPGSSGWSRWPGRAARDRWCVLTKADLVPDADEVAEDVRRRRARRRRRDRQRGDRRGRRRACGSGSTGRLTARPASASSGHGKSSLTNALVGAEVLGTRAIRDDGRGRHTSVRRELVPLPGGGAVIDTPGLRGFGLIDAEAGLARDLRRRRGRSPPHAASTTAPTERAGLRGRGRPRRRLAAAAPLRELAAPAARAAVDRLARRPPGCAADRRPEERRTHAATPEGERREQHGRRPEETPEDVDTVRWVGRRRRLRRRAGAGPARRAARVGRPGSTCPSSLEAEAAGMTARSSAHVCYTRAWVDAPDRGCVDVLVLSPRSPCAPTGSAPGLGSALVRESLTVAARTATSRWCSWRASRATTPASASPPATELGLHRAVGADPGAGLPGRDAARLRHDRGFAGRWSTPTCSGATTAWACARELTRAPVVWRRYGKRQPAHPGGPGRRRHLPARRLPARCGRGPRHRRRTTADGGQLRLVERTAVPAGRRRRGARRGRSRTAAVRHLAPYPAPARAPEEGDLFRFVSICAVGATGPDGRARRDHLRRRRAVSLDPLP